MSFYKTSIIFIGIFFLCSCQTTSFKDISNNDEDTYRDKGDRLKRELERVLSKTNNLKSFEIQKVTL